MSRGRRRTQRGSTLLEVVTTGAVVLISLGTCATSVLSLHSARVTAEDEEEAQELLRSAMSTLRSRGTSQSYTRYRPGTDGRPFPAEGCGDGERFAARRLHRSGQSAEIEIEFFTDERAAVPELGLPRDLDGDGKADRVVVDGLDGSLLSPSVPVQLRLEYRSRQGRTRQLRWNTYLSEIER